MEPKLHSKPRYMPGDYLIALLATSSSTDLPEAILSSQDASPERAESTTTDKIWYKDYCHQTYVRGSRRGGRDDSWVFTPGGKHAIRVHLRPQKTLSTPGRLLRRASPVSTYPATTELRKWSMASRSTSWPTTTIDTGRSGEAPTRNMDGRNHLRLGCDYCEKAGTTRTRCHNHYTCDLCHPADDTVGGPDTTTWRTSVQPSSTLTTAPTITSRTPQSEVSLQTSHERGGHLGLYGMGPYPQVYDHDVTEESRLPRQAPAHKDPAPEERELHSLTQLP